MSHSEVRRALRAQLETDLILGGKWLPLPWPAPSPAKPGRPVIGGAAKSAGEEGPLVYTADKEQRLLEVANQVTHCKRCPLHQTRTRPVPGEGNADARIVFVGEAPGQREDEQGRPFVGPAGKLLTKIIEAMGLKREEVFICNILKSRPPHNRDPQPTEIVACIGYLQEQLEIIEPDVIVALGAHAAKTLLDSTASIGELRGKVHPYQPSPLMESIKLVATYHPAYLLRNYTKESRLRVWQDMQLVLRELGLPIPNL